MRTHSIIRTLAVAALLAIPSVALAAPDQNTNPGQYNNGCPAGTWNYNGQCVNIGQWNNGQSNGCHRHHDRDDNEDGNNQGNNGHHYGWNNPNNPHYNGGCYSGGYNNGRYGNRGGNLSGVVASFSPYNLYLRNGTHVELHNGTVINPTGINLGAGQRVRVIGYWNQDGTFAANEIDVTGGGYGYRY